MVIVVVVFSHAFSVGRTYPAYVLAGLLAWNFFAQGTLHGTSRRARQSPLDDPGGVARRPRSGHSVRGGLDSVPGPARERALDQGVRDPGAEEAMRSSGR